MLHFENKFTGLTILSVLTAELGFSRKSITKLKQKKDGILLNGTHATVRTIIRKGDTLTINFDDSEDEENEHLLPSEILPNIIFEDGDIVVVNKPENMPTHPSHGHFDDTLANSLAYYYKLQSRPFVFRSINRLDRNTSGAILVAKNKLAAYRLSKSMKDGEIQKAYLAILVGSPNKMQGTITTYIRRKEKSIIFREVCDKRDDAKLAVTNYRVIAKNEKLSLVLASPVTGRTHQLRLHFAYVGAPILGDDLYAETSDMISRHALHAYSLCFKHPATDEKITVFAKIPQDMQKIINENFKQEDISNELKLC